MTRTRVLLVLVPVVGALLFWLSRPASSAGVAGALPALPSSVEIEVGPASSSSVDATPEAEVETAAADSKPALEVLSDGALIVDLNRASEQDLRRLSGIGPGRARAILALRDKLGRFKSIDDLLRIKGFGKATLRRLRPQLRV
ncbi:MAG: helix-hairpin-helix domain-containing protein [Myxococcales bacterium]|nr:helix-hairpin-helix domain-containing protein [Myxococcales bacterium]